MMQILQPPGWARAKGFSNGIAASGKLVFIAGQVGWTGQGEWKEKSFAGQFRQTLAEHPRRAAEAGGQARAHRAPDLVRARQARSTSPR